MNIWLYASTDPWFPRDRLGRIITDDEAEAAPKCKHCLKIQPDLQSENDDAAPH